MAMTRLSADRVQRLARARAVLRAVETAEVKSQSLKEAPVARPSAEHPVVAVPTVSVIDPQRGREFFSEVVPPQLRQRGIVAITGSTTVLLAALGEVMDADARNPRWAALLGMPEIGMAAAAEQGIDLERLAVVPEVGTQGAAIIAAALDGIDIVVCGPQASVAQLQQRKITARVRRHQRLLLSTYPWQNADLTLRVIRQRWWGTEQGHGWLRHAEAEIARSGRGAFAQPVHGSVDLLGRAAG
ncbi:hypothetical protein SAMN06309944_0273 [Micrococcales bacterium KH10]|nr:hypothetical protein SAMN06309944_0273 [Micrococcales bacterium KH10]